MDRHQFDHLARFLAVSGSRRGLLGGAAAALPGLPLASALAAKRKKRKTRQARKQKRKRRNTPGGGAPQTLTFCQDGQTITAPSDQKAVLLAAGATLGACSDPGDRCADTGEACTASADCCGAQVCGGGKTNAQICRPNHAPVALDVSVRNPWKSPCVPITFQGYEPDFDLARVRIVTAPQRGFLTQYVGRAVPDAAAAPGSEVGRDGGGWSAGLPAPELPHDLPRDCAPRCFLFAACPANEECADCTLGVDSSSRSWWFRDGDGNLVPTVGIFHVCPEGWYMADSLCYIPYTSTFKGTDSFTYSLIDEHGAEGPVARVNIDIYET